MTLKKNKIGILGVGAIGSTLSYELLQKDNNELFYFSRTKKNFLKIIANDIDFETQINVETKITNSPNLDWLIICLKEHQYAEANEWFSQLIYSKVNIAVVRNGLRLKEPILHFISENRILECLIDCPTQLNKNGFYEQLHSPVITTVEGLLATKFESLFNKNQIEIRKTDDFKTASWKKLCESSSLGAILCLSGETCWIFKDEKMRDLYEDILKESILVAKADGAKIEDNYLCAVNINVVKGKRLEAIEWINRPTHGLVDAGDGIEESAGRPASEKLDGVVDFIEDLEGEELEEIKMYKGSCYFLYLENSKILNLTTVNDEELYFQVCSKDYIGETEKGITIGMDAKKVTKKYGMPDIAIPTRSGMLYYYSSPKIVFFTNNGKVERWMVYRTY